MSEPEKLERGLGLLEATSLNMTFMVGIGPFVVIPFVVQAMGGPQSLLAWVTGALLALFDGCIWAELGAAMPQAGGSYVFLREAYGPGRWGRLMSFLYIWQTLFQGPLSIASGALGFAGYSTYLTGKSNRLGVASSLQSLGSTRANAIAAAVVILAVVLLYRRITTVGKISIALCVVVVAHDSVADLWRRNSLPAESRVVLSAQARGIFRGCSWRRWATRPCRRFTAISATTMSAILGGEMKNPEKNIPRAIFISIVGIAILYFAMQTSILGVIPWQEAAKTKAVVSLFVERVYGPSWATLATSLILVTRVRLDFLGDARLFAHSVRGGARRKFLFRVRARPPHEAFPACFAAGAGRDGVVFCLSLSLDRRDSRHPGDALPHPIRRPGGRTDASAPPLGNRAAGRSECGFIRCPL